MTDTSAPAGEVTRPLRLAECRPIGPEEEARAALVSALAADLLDRLAQTRADMELRHALLDVKLRAQMANAEELLRLEARLNRRERVLRRYGEWQRCCRDQALPAVIVLAVWSGVVAGLSALLLGAVHEALPR